VSFVEGPRFGSSVCKRATAGSVGWDGLCRDTCLTERSVHRWLARATVQVDPGGSDPASCESEKASGC